jgi:hypothetical protein
MLLCFRPAVFFHHHLRFTNLTFLQGQFGARFNNFISFLFLFKLRNSEIEQLENAEVGEVL